MEAPSLNLPFLMKRKIPFTPEQIDFALAWIERKKKLKFPVEEPIFDYHHGLARRDFEMMLKIENRTLERPS